MKRENRLPKPRKVPLQNDDVIMRPTETCPNISEYQADIGSLNYIVNRVRPDLVIYVSLLAKYMKFPTVHHQSLVYRLIAYLYNTRYYVMRYKANDSEKIKINVYSDANFYSKECYDGRSTSGTVVKIDECVTTWQSKRQSIIAEDNCAAELYALNSLLKNDLFVKNLLAELDLIEKEDKMMILEDNKGAKAIAGGQLSKNSKHYNIALLHINDFIKRKEVEIIYVNTEDNLADLYTKMVANKTDLM